MNFIHAREYLNGGDVVVLSCDTQCNFRIVDDSNFSAFKRGSQFKYYGGYFKGFPARIAVPHAGNWNVVVDLGGAAANIKYSISYLKQN